MRHGYFSSIGEIAPFFRISLWGKEIKRTERVELLDETIDMEVIEMADVITRCWNAYLSLDKIGAGGWVTKKGCTFFEKQFKVGTDEYKYVLLAHEGQHWADLKNYSGLKQTDMEYRAKLVELYYLWDELERFFRFIDTMIDTDDRTYPHAYAERKLIQGLSRKIFDTELETDKSKWAEKADELPEAMLELFKEHNAMMAQRKGDEHVI